jgi:hypothetical protein
MAHPNGKYNLLGRMPPEQRTSSRYTIIRTVLATDLAQGQRCVRLQTGMRGGGGGGWLRVQPAAHPAPRAGT